MNLGGPRSSHQPPPPSPPSPSSQPRKRRDGRKRGSIVSRFLRRSAPATSTEDGRQRRRRGRRRGDGRFLLSGDARHRRPDPSFVRGACFVQLISTSRRVAFGEGGCGWRGTSRWRSEACSIPDATIDPPRHVSRRGAALRARQLVSRHPHLGARLLAERHDDVVMTVTTRDHHSDRGRDSATVTSDAERHTPTLTMFTTTTIPRPPFHDRDTRPHLDDVREVRRDALDRLTSAAPTRTVSNTWQWWWLL